MSGAMFTEVIECCECQNSSKCQSPTGLRYTENGRLRSRQVVTRHKARRYAEQGCCYEAQDTLLRGTRQVVTRHKAGRYKAACYAAQGSLLRGTRHFVTRHKTSCYAAQGSLLRGTRHFVTRNKAGCYLAPGTLRVADTSRGMLM